MSHQVRKHTRTVNGKTVTVRNHQAADPAAAQKKRHAFERRVQREQQQAEAAQLRERQAGEALYTPLAGRKPRTPGERKRKRGLRPARARRNAKKALRLWRRHKVRALMYAGMAAGEYTAWAACKGAALCARAARKLRARAKRRRAR